MKAEAILSSRWRDLYPSTASADVHARWREFARVWHPDHCRDPRAADVFAHVTKLRDRALGGSQLPVAEFPMADGRKFRFQYLSERPWEAGRVYVTNSAVVYHVRVEEEDLAQRAAGIHFQYPDDRLRDELSRFLPQHVRTVHPVGGGRLMIYRRTPDQILLADVLDSAYAAVPDIHVMWMISSMLNIASGLFVMDMTHFGIQPEVLLLSPSMHSVAITGPCLYMTEIPQRPPAVPSEVLAAWPQLRDRKAKVPYFVADLQQIRRIAMRALGIHDFATLRNAQINEGLRMYLSSPPGKNPVDEYKFWVSLRGKRKFSQFDLKPEQVYDLEA